MVGPDECKKFIPMPIPSPSCPQCSRAPHFSFCPSATFTALAPPPRGVTSESALASPPPDAAASARRPLRRHPGPSPPSHSASAQHHHRPTPPSVPRRLRPYSEPERAHQRPTPSSVPAAGSLPLAGHCRLPYSFIEVFFKFTLNVKKIGRNLRFN
jgi:hypothetical protein